MESRVRKRSKNFEMDHEFSLREEFSKIRSFSNILKEINVKINL